MSIKFEKNFWDRRYQRGKTSWPSWDYTYESSFITDKIRENCPDVKSILDVGCGDMQFADMIVPIYNLDFYLGTDVSSHIVKRNEDKYDPGKFTFELCDGEYSNYSVDMTLCLNVLFHILDDDNYNNTIKILKNSWKRYLVIATLDDYGLEDSVHVKIRQINPADFCTDFKKIVIPGITGAFKNTKFLYIFKR